MSLNKSIFFITGRSRSGTTLLRTMLDMHPCISIPNECTFILQLSKKYKKAQFRRPEILNRFINDLAKTWLYDNLKTDIEKFRTEVLKLSGNVTYSEICKHVILNTPSALSKPDILWAGDKNPSYSLYFNELYQIFENTCKYIFIIRDYRDQYVSLKNAGFEIPDVVVAAKRWVKTYKDFLKFRLINEDVFYLIRYEDLVKNPEKELAEICSFLNLNYNPAMLNFNNEEYLLTTFPAESLNGIHSSIKEPLTINKINSWKKSITQNQLKILDKIAGKYVNMSGYKPCTDINSVYFFFISFSGYCLYYFTLLSSQFIKWMPFHIYLKLSGGAFLGKIWNSYFTKK